MTSIRNIILRLFLVFLVVLINHVIGRPIEFETLNKLIYNNHAEQEFQQFEQHDYNLPRQPSHAHNDQIQSSNTHIDQIQSSHTQNDQIQSSHTQNDPIQSSHNQKSDTNYYSLYYNIN